MSEAYFAKKINQRPDEEILAVLHCHPIIYLKQIIVTAVLILVTFFLMFALLSRGPLGVALFLALLLMGIFYGGREFYLWYFNACIITNQRVIDIDQKGFFNKTVSEIPFDKILDISYSVKGFWQTILKLGTIKIQAAAAGFLIENIKEVGKINQLLIDLIRKQTGKKIEVKEVEQLTDKQKEKLTDDFLNQEELAQYAEYNLAELIEEYKETFGDLSLKKLLVEELEKSDNKSNKDRGDALAKTLQVDEQSEEEMANFRQKKL
ncbi:MAG: PH domain-containing protein [Candidatus Parcubacteria bacterium]|nr:PH domain-containing protein [Candidatus Parcubacteria bacterium]